MSVEDQSEKKNEERFSIDVIPTAQGAQFWADYHVLRAVQRRHGDDPMTWHQLARALADELEERRVIADTMVEHYKEQVAAAALDAAIKYEWCDEVAEVMRSVGIELEDPALDVELTVTYRFSGAIRFNQLASVSKDGVGFILQHLHVPSLVVETPADSDLLGIEPALTLPGGYADPAEVRVKSYEVRNQVKHPDPRSRRAGD